jgi:hypothetical protein
MAARIEVEMGILGGTRLSLQMRVRPLRSWLKHEVTGGGSLLPFTRFSWWE